MAMAGRWSETYSERVLHANAIGAEGVDEPGTVSAPPVSAIVDVLALYRVWDMPLRSAKLPRSSA
jgi:hypothetical protein